MYHWGAQGHRTQEVSRKMTLTVGKLAKKLVRFGQQASAKLVNMRVFHGGMRK